MKLTMASFAMLTPYPGTRLYWRLLAEGRLTDPRWLQAAGYWPLNLMQRRLAARIARRTAGQTVGERAATGTPAAGLGAGCP